MTLAPEHLEDLRKSGLSDATIRAAGFKSIKADGWPLKNGAQSGYAIPYSSLNGSGPFERVRLFYKTPEEGKKHGKYSQKAGTQPRLYLPPNLDRKKLDDPRAPIIITEGEKKALKAVQEGLLCIAVAGWHTWKVKGREMLIQDFKHIHLEGREVVIVPDNDYGSNKGVRDGVRRLRRQLTRRGAAVRVQPIPHGPLKGLDDFLIENSVEEFLALAPLKKVSIDLGAALPAPEYAVEQLAPVNEVTLGGGHGGSGKTILALTMAAHFAASQPWGPFGVRGGRAVYISMEDGAALLLHRLKRIVEVYKLPAHTIEKNLVIIDGSDGDAALCVETNEFGVRGVRMTDLFEEVKEACKGAGLVIIDNASDVFAGDEISRRQVRRFVRELRNLARENNAGIILLAHIDKAAARLGAGGNSYSGSTAWHNSARSRIALKEKDGGVQLIQEKHNMAKKLDGPVMLRWTEGVLTFGEGDARDAEERANLHKIAVLAAIEAAIKDGVDVPTARTGPSTCQGALERFPDLPEPLRGKRGREAFYAALTELHREGAIAREEFKTPARHTRERFKVVKKTPRRNKY